MEEKMLEYFRRTLEAELDQLLSSAGTAVGELLGAASDNEADLIDRAAQGISQDHIYRIRSRESRLIRKIKDRLDAIEDGTYGICQDCEEPISIKRLKARPVASYCIACKTRREAFKKAVGY